MGTHRSRGNEAITAECWTGSMLSTIIVSLRVPSTGSSGRWSMPSSRMLTRCVPLQAGRTCGTDWLTVDPADEAAVEAAELTVDWTDDTDEPTEWGSSPTCWRTVELTLDEMAAGRLASGALAGRTWRGSSRWIAVRT